MIVKKNNSSISGSVKGGGGNVKSSGEYQDEIKQARNTTELIFSNKESNMKS